MRYLALDVGHKRIGLAMTDPLGWTVQPVTTLERTRLEQDLETIVGYVQDYGVTTIVVGIPLRGVEGEVGIQAKKMLHFKEELRVYCAARGLTVELVTWDESMTTKEAEEILRETGATNKRRRKDVDKLAAAMLLQSYLASLEEGK